jgi:16S rRNA (guanine966-N2)-methyltransferase
VRIIGGALAGRRIDAPAGQSTRPTADRVREAVFNRLAHNAFGDHGVDEDPFARPVLDLYAGAGGLGLEALSRGAPRCDFVDSAAGACGVIRRNLAALGLTARAAVVHSKVDAFLRRAKEQYGLVFADPPYADAGAPLAQALSAVAPLLLPGALVVVEHGDHAAPDEPDGLRLLDCRRYGQTLISFFAAAHAMGGTE